MAMMKNVLIGLTLHLCCAFACTAAQAHLHGIPPDIANANPFAPHGWSPHEQGHDNPQNDAINPPHLSGSNTLYGPPENPVEGNPNTEQHSQGGQSYTGNSNAPRGLPPISPPGWQSGGGRPVIHLGPPPSHSNSNTRPTQSSSVNSNPKNEEHDIQFPNITYNFPTKYDYANALAKSMLFYEAQRSGELPYDHRIGWRGSSAENDGNDVGIDLSGGYYDGVGYIKYGFPMAYTTTVLSWGIIRYRRTYEAIGQLEHALETIKWATDYFLKCKRGPTTFYGQVSDQTSDSSYYGIPERMTYNRKSYVLTKDRPGTELIAETAAALAAASIVFHETDPTYSEMLIHNAVDLYDFAADYKRTYHDSIKPVRSSYRSHNGYADELVWAALWIYRSTGDTTYLRKAKNLYKSEKIFKSKARQFSWDDKKVGVQLLFSELTKGKEYEKAVMEFCDYCLPTGEAEYTKKGLLYLPTVSNWGSLRYAANAAFICTLAAELELGDNYNDYRNFALNQIKYILGSTGRSYVVGFGKNPPKKYRHKASYCPRNRIENCPHLSMNLENAHVLYGALVGGPDKRDRYTDSITERGQTSVALDYNAGYQSALASVLDLHIYGMSNRPKLDKPGKLPKPKKPEASSKEGVGEESHAYDYAQALQYSLLFYEAQRSGKLPADNRIPWRFDSALSDGKEFTWDLTGGYYDGGDYIKYTYPLAFTMTMLSWGLIEFPDAYASSESYIVDALAWGANYLLKTHVESQDIVITQVGDVFEDMRTWDRPEYINQNSSRPVKYLLSTHPGSDLTSEMAAAFASMSIALQNMTSKDYRDMLIGRAKSLFKLASSNRGIYSKNRGISTKGLYDSTGYEDELAWAAMWIYKATGDTGYLNYAKTVYNSEKLLSTPKTFSYDDKRAGLHLLFAQNTDEFTEIVKFCDRTVGSAKTTSGGLFYEGLPPTKHAGNVAFILLLMVHNFPTYPNANKWKNFARNQIDYILGSTGRSFMVGYGKKFPLQPYHKASSCPEIPRPCGEEYRKKKEMNPMKLYGAVVAGPDEKDYFHDSRTKKEYTAVSLDTNAGVQSSLAALYSLQQRGLLNSSNRPSSFLSNLPLSAFFLLMGHILFNNICKF